MNDAKRARLAAEADRTIRLNLSPDEASEVHRALSSAWSRSPATSDEEALYTSVIGRLHAAEVQDRVYRAEADRLFPKG